MKRCRIKIKGVTVVVPTLGDFVCFLGILIAPKEWLWLAMMLLAIKTKGEECVIIYFTNQRR